MRLISFALTKSQVRAGKKTVTRRLGWASLKPGTVLRGVEKAQGIPKGEHAKTVCYIEVLNVSRDPLDWISDRDVKREGFPQMTAGDFVAMFCKHMKCETYTVVTRIEFRKISKRQALRVDAERKAAR